MNILYARTILYAYPCTDILTKQIDYLVEKKALASMQNYVPCEELCDKIIDLTEQKKKILRLYVAVSNILPKFSEKEIDCINYKYFNNRNNCCQDIKYYSTRAYYRKQLSILKALGGLLEKQGIDDKVFENLYLKMPFYRELYRRIKKKEENMYKKFVCEERVNTNISKTLNKNDVYRKEVV